MSQPRISDEQLTDWFTYHPPLHAVQIQDYKEIREAGRVFATTIRDVCPVSADTSAAIRHVREAVWTANASVACAGS